MTTEECEPRLASDRVILGVVAAYAAAFVALGFVVQTPAGLLRGLGAILTTRDALLTDYFGVGGVGGGCVSAGLLTLATVSVYWRAGAQMTGGAVACLFLVLGFGLFGKNLLNVWPIVAGVALYARFRGEPFRAHLNTAFFGAALAPIFSEILFSTDLAPVVSVPLALATGLGVGFILPAAAAHLFRTHMGFSLYNMGFTAGVVGTLVVAMYKAFGYVPDPVFIWTKGAERDIDPQRDPGREKGRERQPDQRPVVAVEARLQIRIVRRKPDWVSVATTTPRTPAINTGAAPAAIAPHAIAARNRSPLSGLS